MFEIYKIGMGSDFILCILVGKYAICMIPELNVNLWNNMNYNIYENVILDYLTTKNVSIHVGAVEVHQGRDEGDRAGTSIARR